MEEAMKDHNLNLAKLLERLTVKNFKINEKKVKICQTELQFFGHVLTSEGLKPDEDKKSAIKYIETPKDKKELLRFLGMTTYLSR